MNENKKNRGLIVLVVILVLALVVTSGYIVYDKFIAKEEVEEKNKDNKKDEASEEAQDELVEVDVNSEEIQTLFTNISNGLTSYCGVNNYYQDKKVLASDLSNDLVFDIALLQIYREKQAQGIEYPFSQIGDAFTASELETKIRNTFGKNYSFTHRTINSCPIFEYDSANQKYVINTPPACGGTCGPTNLKKVVRALKNNQSIELYVRVLFAGGASATDYYKDYNKTQKVEGLELDSNTTFPIESDNNVAKGSLYKLTFSNEDGSYVFVSSELVVES